MTDSPEKKTLTERAADMSDAMFESSEAPTPGRDAGGAFVR